jgi:hypothetical protein
MTVYSINLPLLTQVAEFLTFSAISFTCSGCGIGKVALGRKLLLMKALIQRQWPPEFLGLFRKGRV